MRIACVVALRRQYDALVDALRRDGPFDRRPRISGAPIIATNPGANPGGAVTE
jgi:hypothetical protein